MSKCKGCFNEHSAQVIGKGVCADCKESTPMTDQEMLKEWVQAGIDGGWKGKYPSDNSGISSVNDRAVELCYYYRTNDPPSEGECYISYTLPDLIADGGFMKAVYGDAILEEYSMVETWEQKREDGTKSFGGKRVKVKVPAYTTHAIQAIRILHNNGNAVKYLWENMKKETL